jgi:hypothetical protein
MEQKTFDAILVRFDRHRYGESDIYKALNKYCEERKLPNRSNVIRLALHAYLEKQKYLPLKQKHEKKQKESYQS